MSHALLESDSEMTCHFCAGAGYAPPVAQPLFPIANSIPSAASQAPNTGGDPQHRQHPPNLATNGTGTPTLCVRSSLTNRSHSMIS